MEIAKLPRRAIPKRLWHVLRAVYYLLHKGIKRSKICRHVGPREPSFLAREVEFSCSNTPWYAAKRRTKRCNCDRSAEAVAEAFEILNSLNLAMEGSSAETPSPISIWRRSPAVIRELRVTDSPFPLAEEGGEIGKVVDREAEDFIRRFYQQLRLQQQPLLGRA